MKRYRDSVNPKELAMLQSVLDRFCLERGLAGDSAEREDAAAALLAMFIRGVVKEDDLSRNLNAGL